MKYYIATTLDNWRQHNDLRDALRREGHEITYDWTLHLSVWREGWDRCVDIARKELKGIDDAHVVLVLLPGGRGTHVELGYAIAKEKTILIYSEQPELLTPSPDYCLFYTKAMRISTLDRIVITMKGL